MTEIHLTLTPDEARSLLDDKENRRWGVSGAVQAKVRAALHEWRRCQALCPACGHAFAHDHKQLPDVPNQQTKEDGHESHQDQGADERD